jgi:hypothetical protein
LLYLEKRRRSYLAIVKRTQTIERGSKEKQQRGKAKKEAKQIKSNNFVRTHREK